MGEISSSARLFRRYFPRKEAFASESHLIFMYYQGILIGIISFLTIGLFHPIVIKTEYYIGKKAWPVFLAVGILLTVGALFIPSTFWGAVVAVVAFSSFWSIKELFEQEKRVKKGWFPANPKKKKSDSQQEKSEK